MNTAHRNLLLASRALALAGLLFASWASAPARAAERPRVALKELKGKAAGIEAAITAALEDDGNAVVLTPKEWKRAAAKVGNNFLRVAIELDLTSALEVRASQKGKKATAVIKVLSGANGRVLKTWRPSAADSTKLAALVQRTLWRELGAVIKSGQANDEPLARPEEDADEAALAAAITPAEQHVEEVVKPAAVEAPAAAAVSVEPARPAGSRSTSALGLGLDFAFFTRKLTYKDDLFGRLRPYSLGGAPAPRVSVWWYPATHFTTGLLTHLGAGLSLDLPIALASADSSGREYPTKSMEIEGTLRGRLPLGAHEVVALVGAGRHMYSVGDAPANGETPAVAAGIPDVGYTYLRLGAQGRFEILPELQLSAGAAFRPLLSAGEIASSAWFGRASAAGIDAHLSVAYQVWNNLDVVAKGELRRYFYSMNPEPQDANVAGGATDQYLAGSLGVAWHL